MLTYEQFWSCTTRDSSENTETINYWPIWVSQYRCTTRDSSENTETSALAHRYHKLNYVAPHEIRQRILKQATNEEPAPDDKTVAPHEIRQRILKRKLTKAIARITVGCTTRDSSENTETYLQIQYTSFWTRCTTRDSSENTETLLQAEFKPEASKVAPHEIRQRILKLHLEPYFCFSDEKLHHTRFVREYWNNEVGMAYGIFGSGAPHEIRQRILKHYIHPTLGYVVGVAPHEIRQRILKLFVFPFTLAYAYRCTTRDSSENTETLDFHSSS